MLNTNDYEAKRRFDSVNRPVNKLEWSSFPNALRAHTVNLCPEVDNANHDDLLLVLGAAAESIYLGAGSDFLKHKFAESAAAYGD